MWMKLYTNSRSHPKILVLASECGICQAQALGHICALWTWAMEYAPDGDVTKYTVPQVEELGCLWNGEPGALYNCLITVGLLSDNGNGGICIHDWEPYSGSHRLAINQKAYRKRRYGKPLSNALSNALSIDKKERKNIDPVCIRSSELHKSNIPVNSVGDVCKCPTSTNEPKPICVIPLDGGKNYEIHQSDVESWSDVYRNCDVLAEVKKMREWCLSNPRRLKKNGRRFAVNWLSRVSEKPSSTVDNCKVGYHPGRDWTNVEDYDGYGPPTEE